MKFLLFLLCSLTALGCQKRPDPPTQQELDSIAVDAPTVFKGAPHVSLEGLDGIWLGQSQQEAEAVMSKMCKRFVELKESHAMFKGCHLPDHPFVYTFRVGFSPKIDNRVFTLETKRRPVDQDLVRKRIWQVFPHLKTDYVRTGLLRAETQEYNMFADWEDGLAGPAHILVGLSDAEVTRLAGLRAGDQG